MGGKASLIPCDFGNDVQWLTRYFVYTDVMTEIARFKAGRIHVARAGLATQAPALRGYAPTGPWHGLGRKKTGMSCLPPAP